MAAVAVLDVIGALTGIVSIGMMIPSLLPQQDEHQTVVRVGAGLSSVESSSTSGDRPGIHLYDIMGRAIGHVHSSKKNIRDGDFIDISVPFDRNVGKKPTEYISVNQGGDDALCIAYLALTQPDGTKKAWYGDIGKTCGADWYHSMLKTGDDDYQPACIWIDKNGSNGLRFQGFGLHITDFAATKERAADYDQHRDRMCNAAPRFRMYEQMNDKDFIPFFSPPLEYISEGLTDQDPSAVLDKGRWALPEEGPNIKKSTVDADPLQRMMIRRDQTQAPRQGQSQTNDTLLPAQSVITRLFESKLIISHSNSHSAKELCESSSSKGPDFVSIKEQSYCDMTHRKIWPLCDARKKTSNCFDQTSHRFQPLAVRGRDVGAPSASPSPPQKSYTKVETWQ